MSTPKHDTSGDEANEYNMDHIDSPEISPSVFSLTHETDKTHININDDKRQFKLFGNQVAGTLPMLHSDGLLYKPLKTDLEMTFYEKIMEWLPSIKPFIPKYSGIKYIHFGHEHDGNENDDNHNNEKIISNDDSADDEEHDHDNMEDEELLFDLNTNNKWSQQMYKKNKHRIGKMPFLILEDLTKKYVKPCILDLKIGTRHFAPICKTTKKERKLRKAWCSTCKDFGVRIGGIQIYNQQKCSYDVMAKDIGMMLEKNEFCQRIGQFFGNAQQRILRQFITKLNELYDILKDENRFRWFSCSLLFVYEGGHEQDVNDTDEDGIDSEHKMDEVGRDELEDVLSSEDDEDEEHEVESFDAQRLDLRLIDFTNFVIVEKYLDRLSKANDVDDGNENEVDENEEVLVDDEDEEEDKNGEILQLKYDLDNLNEPDHGILFGLDALIKLLCELEKTGSIKRRNDSQWLEFRDDISSSKMALRPFKNKNQFNEHTTI